MFCRRLSRGWNRVSPLHLVLGEMENATRRISGLVGAIKEYSHMDRELTEKTETDLHRALDSTLTMLGHKAKVKQVKVSRDYDPYLPAIHAFPGELNQVWTNLLDNALDAANKGGSVRVGTRRVDGRVEVEIADDGPGIPVELASRIWEPFLHHQADGAGHGPGPGHRPPYRGGAAWRRDAAGVAARRHPFSLVSLPIGDRPPVRA